MAKTKISEFDVDPANNTDINNINIAEGCAPSGINNAIRQLMSDLKEFQTGAGGDPFNGAVNGTVGATTPATGAFTTLSASSTATLNTLSSSGATITGGSINGTTVGASTASTGAFTTLSASGAFSANGGATLGDASGDALTINSSAVSIPNGLNFDSNTLVIDATNNNIGIGTATPTGIGSNYRNLVLLGNNGSNIDLNDSSSTVRATISTNNSGGDALFVDTRTSHPIVFRTTSGTLERMRIASNGNVGIGTNNPSHVLDVSAGSGSPTIRLLRTSTTGADLRLVSTAVADGAIVGTYSNSPLLFVSNSSERMRIDSSGRVLVGNSSSYNTNSRLQVTSDNIGVDRGAGGQAIMAITSDAFATDKGASLGLGGKNSGGGNVVFGAIAGRSEGSGNAGYLQFATLNSGGTMSERMRITSTGNVGIGTSSPSQNLSVVSSGATEVRSETTATDGSALFSLKNDNSIPWLLTTRGDANDSFLIRRNGINLLNIDTSGNLGLGVTPSAWGSGLEAFEVGNAGSALTSFGVADVRLYANAYYSAANRYAGTGLATLYQQAAGEHKWYTAPSGTAGNAITFTQAMTLDASGNLLVGKTSATANGGDIQVSRGITFPATQSAQSDANTLDDYEEGTFTPAIAGTTTAGTGTYSSRLGRYTKIGDTVFVQIWFNMQAHTGTGNMIVTGLPFTTLNLGGPAPSANFARIGNLTLPENSIIAGFGAENTTTITLQSRSTAGGNTTDAALALDTAFTLNISMTYKI
jgi:hypothetical protein